MKRSTKNRILTNCGLLLTAIALAGCGATAAMSGPSSAPAQSASQSEATAAAQPDCSVQLQLLAEQAAVWAGDTELTAEPYFYAVTDLDQNGRLELVQASCQGTGLYTYTQIWEVNADATEIAPCPFSAPEGDSQPDLITDPDAVYFDEAEHRYFYIFRDDIRNGAAEYWQSRFALSLQDGTVQITLLTQSHSLYSADSSAVTTYTDAAGNAIDEAAYNTAAETAFVGLTPLHATIGWTDAAVSEQLAGLRSEGIKAILERSWEGFSLK